VSLFVVIALTILAWQARLVFGHLVQSCGGLDSAGYLGESQLLLAGHVTEPVPVARVLPLRSDVATAAAAPLGFVPAAVPFRIAPRFPPGFPIALAAARALAGASAPFFVPPVFGFGAVCCIALLVRARMGAIAACLAAVMLACSPVFVDMALQPMSDAPAAFWTTLAACLAWRARPRAILAGIAIGMAILTRPPLALAALTLLLVSPWQGWRRASAYGAVVAGFVALLLAMQWRMYGDPFRSGYGTAGQLFTWASIAPNSLLQTN